MIDGDSCNDVGSEEACKKLRMKIESHPSPYKVAWVNNMNLLVQKRCLVTYSLRGFTDQVMYDVLSLKVCHILLGHL